MNLKWLPALATLVATQLQANVIELPKGTQIWQLPPYGRQLSFFDEGRVVPWTDADGQMHSNKGWVSMFGVLNGGTMFDTDLFTLDPTPEATLNWDFSDSGFLLRFIVVYDGEPDAKIYRLGVSGSVNPFEGTLLLTSFDQRYIQNIALYGRLPGESVPDNGPTLGLILFGLICIFFYDKTAAC